MDSITKYTGLTLYSYFRSSCSWRIRIALNIKKLPYEIKTVHLLKAENKSEDFEKINPIKKIPVLEFKNEEETVHLSESMAICEFLEDNFTEIRLLPEDSINRAKVRAFCLEIACNIQPIQNLPVLNRIQELGQDKMEWAKEWISKGLEVVEKLVQKSKGKYCFGDDLTLADAFLIPQLYNARRFSVDMSAYPSILEVENNLNALDAFIAAKPENQIDFEK